jgi:putative transposase
VAAKQALNRQLAADAALGRLRHWTCVKAEEAGRRTWAVNPAGISRTCAACGHCDTANRVTRDRFRCQQCGHAAHADLNAAENVAAMGRNCETARAAAGSPPLVRPQPRLQRYEVTVGPLSRPGRLTQFSHGTWGRAGSRTPSGPNRQKLSTGPLER